MKAPWEEIMISTASPLVGSFAMLALVGATAFAIPRLGTRQPEPLVQHSRTLAANSPEVVNRRIVDARLAPYAAVGKFVGVVACTAAIVLDPRIIVTAGHCITERDGSIRKSGLSFRLGYQAGDDLGRFKSSVWAVGLKQSFKRQSVDSASQDWAILLLDRAADGVKPFGLSHHSLAALRSRERQLLMPAYSEDISDADVLSADSTCSIRDLVWNVLLHDCTAGYGSSGAPLLIRDGPGYAVVGIHTGSIFASDQNGHIASFIGYQATGSWTFADALFALARKLDDEALHASDTPMN
jgi:V8-like Glu-specific endopeptidase